jgi:hypothetical protein
MKTFLAMLVASASATNWWLRPGFALNHNGYCDNSSNQRYDKRPGNKTFDQCMAYCISVDCDAFELDNSGSCTAKAYKDPSAITIKESKNWRCWIRTPPYKILSSWCAAYETQKSLGVMSLEQCKEKCTGDAKCDAFNYNKDRQCWLKFYNKIRRDQIKPNPTKDSQGNICYVKQAPEGMLV